MLNEPYEYMSLSVVQTRCVSKDCCIILEARITSGEHQGRFSCTAFTGWPQS